MVTASQKVHLLLRLDWWAEVTTSKAESKLITTGNGAQCAMIPGISKMPPLYVGSCYLEMQQRPLNWGDWAVEKIHSPFGYPR